MKSLLKSITQETLQKQLAEPPIVVPKVACYAERDLHPLLVRFARDRFAAWCKTIYHEKSLKKGQKHNQWLHPDIVGFGLTTQGWNTPVVHLAKSSGVIAAKLYSFELKVSVDFTTLREYFFQAVSNSSWAHEGYLVVAEVDGRPRIRGGTQATLPEFRHRRDSTRYRAVEDSEILLAARERSEVDWETVNRIAEINPDFADFVDCVGKSITINQRRRQGI